MIKKFQSLYMKFLMIFILLVTVVTLSIIDMIGVNQEYITKAQEVALEQPEPDKKQCITYG